MKKFLYSIIIFMILLIPLFGFDFHASIKFNDKINNKKQPRFVLIEKGNNYQIYRDTQTNVMYSVFVSYDGSGVSVIVDKNGKPLLYDKYIENKQ